MSYDIIVIGGGNAALCAAISAAENDASVLVLESSPKKWRGGNSIHTRNMRVAHDHPTPVLAEKYEADEFWEDLNRVTKGETNEALARLAIGNSFEAYKWLEKRGMLFQPGISGTLSLSRTNAFFLGGGKTYVNSEYQYARKVGVDIVYEYEVIEVVLNGKRFNHLIVQTPEGEKQISANAVIAASGGFESNREWLKEVWGTRAENFLIRGTRYNQGKVLKSLLDQGVQSVGRPDQCHAVAIDGRAPLYDGGIVTRLDCVPFGIVLNEEGYRFYDEGEAFWPKRYAIWGRLVAQQPGQIGHVIIDSKSLNLFMPSVFAPTVADTLEDLVEQLGLPKEEALKTVLEYNDHVVEGNFNPNEMDDCRTEGLNLNKTHWARKINKPPFYGYTLRTGITFTYLGVELDEKARVYMENGHPTENIFSAGEMMAGNILGQGYLAGTGMTIGTTFGIIAGREAAKIVNKIKKF